MNQLFNVFILNKCIIDPTSIVPLESLGIKKSISYEEVQVEILDQQVRNFRKKEVAFVKVLWRSHLVKDANWEDEADMMSRYHHLFPSNLILD